MLRIIEQARLSPEQFGEICGLSGMTFRRWRLEEPDKEVPKVYQSACREGVYQLIIDGALQADSKEVSSVLENHQSLAYPAAIKNLGLTPEELKSFGREKDQMSLMLNRIGGSEVRREAVKKGRLQLAAFKKMGDEWRRMISLLNDVIQDAQLSLTEKFVAYGALFYLICPFDLIPDQIPVFGLMDDFAVLVFAVGFYGARHKKNANPRLNKTRIKKKKTDRSRGA